MGDLQVPGAMYEFYIPGLVNIQKAIEHGHWNSEFSHEKWWFSIDKLVSQRVYIYIYLVETVETDMFLRQNPGTRMVPIQ